MKRTKAKRVKGKTRLPAALVRDGYEQHPLLWLVDNLYREAKVAHALWEALKLAEGRPEHPYHAGQTTCLRICADAHQSRVNEIHAVAVAMHEQGGGV